jgi:hypothetical protein
MKGGRDPKASGGAGPDPNAVELPAVSSRAGCCSLGQKDAWCTIFRCLAPSINLPLNVERLSLPPKVKKRSGISFVYGRKDCHFATRLRESHHTGSAYRTAVPQRVPTARALLIPLMQTKSGSKQRIQIILSPQICFAAE